MERPAFFLLAFFVGVLPSTLLPAQELESRRVWAEAVLEEAGCRVLAPGPLTEKVDTIGTAIGPIVYHTFFYRSEGEGPENFVYMLSYCDYPEGSVHSDSTQLLNEFFQTTIEAAAASVDGEIIYVDEVFQQDYPGRFWRINYRDDQAVIRTKAYIVKNRYYAIQTIMHRERSLNPASDRFLDSFRLLE